VKIFLKLILKSDIVKKNQISDIINSLTRYCQKKKNSIRCMLKKIWQYLVPIFFGNIKIQINISPKVFNLKLKVPSFWQNLKVALSKLVNEIDIPTLGKFQQEHLLHQMQNSLHCSICYSQVVEMVELVEYLHIQLQNKIYDKIYH
jgi:hypothetical protein